MGLTVSTPADTWAEAHAKLPDVDALVQLVEDPSLVLPQPESIPVVPVGTSSSP